MDVRTVSIPWNRAKLMTLFRDTTFVQAQLVSSYHSLYRSSIAVVIDSLSSINQCFADFMGLIRKRSVWMEVENA